MADPYVGHGQPDLAIVRLGHFARGVKGGSGQREFDDTVPHESSVQIDAPGFKGAGTRRKRVLGHDLSIRQATDRQAAAGPKVPGNDVNWHGASAARHAQAHPGVVGCVPKPPAAKCLHVVEAVGPLGQQELPLDEAADGLTQPLDPLAINR